MVIDGLQIGLSGLLERPERLMGLLMMGASVFAVIRHHLLRRKLEAALDWPGTVGQILDSYHDTHRAHRGLDGGITIQTSRIQYSYRVDGVTYTSDVVALGGNYDTSEGTPARERLERYPVGAQVEVYYNPQNPEEACLEREIEGEWLIVLVSAVFLLVGSALFLGMIGS
ncbi:MAG: DUF3592 domain-containing protein [Phycisphaeraceae bacterium]|nr:DUF3592 domain-containing protein [Phycisphaeraceae bacterium]